MDTQKTKNKYDLIREEMREKQRIEAERKQKADDKFRPRTNSLKEKFT